MTIGECGYCLAWRGGSAAITTDSGTVYLCHPDQGQDCYRLVTVYHKPLADGRVWAGGIPGWDTTDSFFPPPKED